MRNIFNMLCLEQVCVSVPRLFIKGKHRIIDIPLTSSKVSRESVSNNLHRQMSLTPLESSVIQN